MAFESADPSYNNEQCTALQYQSPNETPPSVAVVEAVADLRNHETTDLDPLYEVIDPDALDALISTQAPVGGEVRISFEYEGVTVVVKHADGLSVIASYE